MIKNHIPSVAITSFIVTTVTLGLLAGIGCYYIYCQEADSVEKVVKVNQRMHNGILSRAISLDLKSLFNDLQLVANHVEVKRFLLNMDSVEKKDLESEFLALCQISGNYDQVRILDNDGMELIRVNNNNGHPAAVPQQKLQNKWGRYYFQESLKLKPGEVYVSPFDLNIENGEIEQPIKPMIRVCMPVYGDTGKRLGIVILNYLGKTILDSIARTIGETNSQSMLLNSDGYWLLSPDKQQEWAFMYKDRKAINIRNIKPEAWERILASTEGQFTTIDGLYTFSTIVVAPKGIKREINGNVRQWKMVCLTPTSFIDASVTQVFNNYAVIFACIFMIILFGSLTRARYVRGRYLGQIKLEKAKQAADDANRAKSDFLARMSHEIRTPMNAIIGLTHLALKTELTPKQNDYLSKVDMSAKSLLGIINDILDFSKIEADRLEVEEADFFLDDVLNDLLNMLGLQAEQKGLEFLLMIRSTVPNLLIGDRLRLGQVLLNLTGNAIKFTQSGEIIITVTLEEEIDNIATIKFSVRDTGLGITPEQSAKLFQPFSQADGSISRTFGGTGLGLAICKRLVEKMGGTLQVESEIGKGSDFFFTIPFKLQPRHTGEHHVYPDELKGMRVLVVDDNRMSRRVLSKVMRSFTFDVETAEGGAQALELLHEHDKTNPFRLVITDWRMPDINGIELAQKVKETNLLDNIPKVIMLTAYGHDEVRHQAEKVTLDGFMLKPFNRSILFDTIMEAFFAGEQMARSVVDKGTRNGVPANVAGTHILLAEDNEINQQIAREILEGAGVTISVANNGKEAVEMARTNPYDAVLMDIQMPEMDGFEAVRMIRSDNKLQSIPVIAMTAHALVGDKEKSLLAGMDDHVTKPIDPDKLMEVLAEWLPDKLQQQSEQPIPASETASPSTPFADLPGIDTAQGLSRVRGNTTLYQKLLNSFAKESEKACAELHTLVSAAEYEEAKTLAHTMKGFSGNIGATGLFTQLQEVGKALKDHPDRVLEMLKALSEARERVVLGIAQAFPDSQHTVSLDEDACITLEEIGPILPRLRELSELMAKHDVQSREVYREIEPELTKSAPTYSREIGSKLDQFDFAGGKALVESIISECEQKGQNDG